MTGSFPNFMVVDDDELNNMICRKYINWVIPGANVVTFTEPELGLKYIIDTFKDANSGSVTLFLDINMPVLSGWDFMDQLENAETGLKERISVYILSSSLNPIDQERANNYSMIKNYLQKPLTIEFIKDMYQNENAGL